MVKCWDLEYNKVIHITTRKQTGKKYIMYICTCMTQKKNTHPKYQQIKKYIFRLLLKERLFLQKLQIISI